MNDAHTNDDGWPWGITPPPGIDEFVTDDGEPMETEKHRRQMTLLIESLQYHVRDRPDVYVNGNMGLFFSPRQAKNNDFRAPDVMVVTGTDKRMRRGWLVWEEGGKIPDLIIELTSPSTAAKDHGEKKQVYERLLHVPDYILFDPHSDEPPLVYRLSGQEYQEVAPDRHGRFPVSSLDVTLGVWEGTYSGTHTNWLRWFRRDGTMVPAPQETAEAAEARAAAAESAWKHAVEERQRAVEERQRAEEERQRAEEERQRAEDRASALEAELEALRNRTRTE